MTETTNSGENWVRDGDGWRIGRFVKGPYVTETTDFTGEVADVTRRFAELRLKAEELGMLPHHPSWLFKSFEQTLLELEQKTIRDIRRRYRERLAANGTR